MSLLFDAGRALAAAALHLTVLSPTQPAERRCSPSGGADAPAMQCGEAWTASARLGGPEVAAPGGQPRPSSPAPRTLPAAVLLRPHGGAAANLGGPEDDIPRLQVDLPGSLLARLLVLILPGHILSFDPDTSSFSLHLSGAREESDASDGSATSAP